MNGLNDTIQFHIIYKLPEHFSCLDNNFSTIKPLNNCILNIHTITENLYDTSDSYSLAEEMCVKMISRQVVL